jgi:hypothetical protein
MMHTYTVTELIEALQEIRAAGNGDLLVNYDADVTVQKDGYLPVTYVAVVDTSEDPKAIWDTACLLSGPEEWQ